MRDITNVHDLCNEVGSSIYDDHERTLAALDKAIFKGTDCGAWLSVAGDTVSVGSIVEGAEECTTVHTLTFPFTPAEFWGHVQDVEEEADEIWKATHGCEMCWPDGYFGEFGEQEFGCWPINPDCEECNGQGVVL